MRDRGGRSSRPADLSSASADDEFAGTYRDCRIRIGELRLERAVHRSTVTTFHGLLVEILLPRPIGATIIVADSRDGDDRGVGAPRGFSQVALNDSRFEQIYSVFSDGEAAARRLLVPSLTEALMQMTDGQSFHPPTFLAQGSRMVFALHRWDLKDLFEPPSLSSHDAVQQLASLRDDIAVVFKLVDAMVDIAERLV